MPLAMQLGSHIKTCSCWIEEELSRGADPEINTHTAEENPSSEIFACTPQPEYN